jgi:phage tail protein X
MKSLGLVLSAVLISASLAFAQSAAPTAPQSEAQKSFDALKALAGNWTGTAQVDPKNEEDNKPLHVAIRVTSRGNALVHEMSENPSMASGVDQDHPVTMFYLDDNRLLLTHYCDAGNRPRMVARPSPDGKKIEFDFLDVAGNTQYGHMQHAVFNIIDANHHTEDWTFLMPGGKVMHGRLDLQRVKENTVASLK